MITTVGASLVGMADVQVAGFLGPAVQAAVGVSEQLIFIFMVFAMAIAVGTTAIVSRAVGQGNQEEANFIAGQSIAFSVSVGTVLCLTALGCAHILLPLFTPSAAVQDIGTHYLSIFSLYLIPFSLIAISNAAFRAIGDAKTPLYVVTIEVIINIAGDYLTVLGNWPVPGLGVRGIAGSAILGAFLGAALALYRISHSPLAPALKQVLPLKLDSVKRLLRLGVPAAFHRLGWAASTLVVFFIMRGLSDPTAALASWTIGMRVEGLLFMPLMALSLAVGSIVGQNLGAQQIARARKAGWNVTGIGILMMLLAGTLLFVLADPIAQLMTRDPTTMQYTADYLRINAIAEPLLAVNMILSGALQGAGDTQFPMWVSLFTNWIVRLPVAYVLAEMLGMGPAGVWWAMTGSVCLAALIIAARFQSGGWARVSV
jgi:putative MATE family efflux protein